MKFRKKPEIVDAFQYDGDLIDSEGNYYVPEWAEKAHKMGILFYMDDSPGGSPAELYCGTPDNYRHIQVGDYVICNEDGSLSVCSASDFERDYEEIAASVQSSEAGSDHDDGNRIHGKMQNYIGVKIVKAEPEEKDGSPGYRVKYPDGYVSWSPKDVFEKAYRILDCEDFINAE